MNTENAQAHALVVKMWFYMVGQQTLCGAWGAKWKRLRFLLGVGFGFGCSALLNGIRFLIHFKVF